MGEVGRSKRRSDQLPLDVAAAFEALVALSDARWAMADLAPNDPAREGYWTAMYTECGKLLQATVWITKDLLAEQWSRALVVRVPPEGSEQ